MLTGLTAVTNTTDRMRWYLTFPLSLHWFWAWHFYSRLHSHRRGRRGTRYAFICPSVRLCVCLCVCLSPPAALCHEFNSAFWYELMLLCFGHRFRGPKAVTFRRSLNPEYHSLSQPFIDTALFVLWVCFHNQLDRNLHFIRIRRCFRNDKSNRNCFIHLFINTARINNKVYCYNVYIGC